MILSLRRESEKRLARNFSLRDFHDVLLSTGAVSLNLLERNVRRWMDTAPLEQAGAD
ncbi:MAG: DUF885 family protein [Sphingomonadales bacterium]|nr:DUF885 family protein [Sphingomonadales bacterium]